MSSAPVETNVDDNIFYTRRYRDKSWNIINDKDVITRFSDLDEQYGRKTGLVLLIVW